MSVFDFPRIHFGGVMKVNVGTGNNDDYSSTPSQSDNNYVFTGCPVKHLRSFNSKEVKLDLAVKQDPAKELTPVEYIDWMKKPQSFLDEASKKPKSIVPGYWNYFGSMSLWAENVKVSKVSTGPCQFVTDPSNTNDALIKKILGAKVSYDRWWPGIDDSPQSKQHIKGKSEELSTAIMTDIKSEGSSPGSQIFADAILLKDVNGDPVFYRNAGESHTYDSTGSKPTKASANTIAAQGYECFFAGTYNGGLVANPGAGATFQCVMPFSDDFVGDDFKAFLDKNANPTKGEIKGIMISYVMYPGFHPHNTTSDLAELYQKDNFFDRLNERRCPVQGVITPWYGEDAQDFASSTLGRELHCVPGLKMETRNWPEGPPSLPISLSPAIATLIVDQKSNDGFLAVDISKAFTSYFPNVGGRISISVGKSLSDSNPIFISNVTYGNLHNMEYVDPGNPWNILRDPSVNVFATPEGGYTEYPLSKEIYDILSNQNSEYPDGGVLILSTDSQLFSSKNNQTVTINNKPNIVLLIEPNYHIINHTRTLYAEQATNGQPKQQSQFRHDNNTPVTSTFQIVNRGKIVDSLPQDETFYMINCATIPLPMAYDNQLQKKQITSMEDLKVTADISEPGSFRFAVVTKTFLDDNITEKKKEDGSIEKIPFETFVDLDAHPIRVAQVRVLPCEDFSQYYVDPTAQEPVGNDSLSFAVIYEQVLKPYHVLYPAMDEVRSLNDPEEWGGADSARKLLERINVENFNKSFFMPRTRDLSESRRKLIQAWCNKTLQKPNVQA